LEKRERGPIQGLHNFWGYSLLSQEYVKLRTSNFTRIFIASIGRKDSLEISGKIAWAMGIVRDSRKFSGHRAHRAVIFAIAQLSCLVIILESLEIIRPILFCGYK